MQAVYKRFLIIALLLSALSFYLSYYLIEASMYERALLALSVGTFVLYGFDKFMAIQQNDRVPEIIFHLLALAGGFFGGWAGMIIFRHKKNKQVFIMVLLLATLVHGYLYINRSQVPGALGTRFLFWK